MKSIFSKVTLVAVLFSIVVLNAGNPRGLSVSYSYSDENGWVSTVRVKGINNKGVWAANINDDKDGFDKASLVLQDFGEDQGWNSTKHLRFTNSAFGSIPNIGGFGNEGYVETNSTNIIVNDFGYDQGWRRDRHLRLLSNNAIVGFGDEGVSMSNVGSGEIIHSPILKHFGYDQGWRNDKHLRFLYNQYNLRNIVGFGDEGVTVSVRNAHDEAPGFKEPTLWLDDFGYNQGWRNDKHLRFATNIDYINAIIGFGDEGVSIAKLNSSEDGYEQRILGLTEFGYNQGWRNDKHIRLLYDVTNDYVNDIVGFKDNAVYVSKGNNDGTFEEPVKWVEDFGYNQGWRNDKHIRMLFDVNVDGYADIVGFGNEGIYVSLNNNGTGFADKELWSDEFGYDQGWRVEPEDQGQQLPRFEKPDSITPIIMYLLN